MKCETRKEYLSAEMFYFGYYDYLNGLPFWEYDDPQDRLDYGCGWSWAEFSSIKPVQKL